MAIVFWTLLTIRTALILWYYVDDLLCRCIISPQGFHLNIEVPREPMEVLQKDFTKVNGKFVMTVVERFSKKDWFILLSAIDAESVAEAFFTKIAT